MGGGVILHSRSEHVGYYLRFISTDPREISLAILQAGLQKIDLSYVLAQTTGTGAPSADLLHGGEQHPYGEVEINSPSDDLFAAERDELLEALPEDGDSEALERVRDALTNARAIVAVRVLFGGRTADEALDRVQPLLQWLHENRTGLVQADAEGFYHGPDLILEE